MSRRRCARIRPFIRPSIRRSPIPRHLANGGYLRSVSYNSNTASRPHPRRRKAKNGNRYPASANPFGASLASGSINLAHPSLMHRNVSQLRNSLSLHPRIPQSSAKIFQFLGMPQRHSAASPFASDEFHRRGESSFYPPPTSQRTVLFVANGDSPRANPPHHPHVARSSRTRQISTGSQPRRPSCCPSRILQNRRTTFDVAAASRRPPTLRSHPAKPRPFLSNAASGGGPPAALGDPDGYRRNRCAWPSAISSPPRLSTMQAAPRPYESQLPPPFVHAFRDHRPRMLRADSVGGRPRPAAGRTSPWPGAFDGPDATIWLFEAQQVAGRNETPDPRHATLT